MLTDLTSVYDGKQFDIGVIIGRFQVDELHDAHIELIKTVAAHHNQVIILVGVSQALLTKNNPLPFTARAQMILGDWRLEMYAHKFTILPLSDRSSDYVWSSQVDDLIKSVCPVGTVRIYGGRDSFAPHYHGHYPIFEFPLVTHPDGTAIRADIAQTIIPTPDFRSGVIWASHNQYPKVFPTVDIAVIDRNTRKLLMGKRSEHSKWRFPGGFVDVKDMSLEQAATRELVEETGLDISPTQVKYLSSRIIDDYRYRNTGSSLLTSLFVVDYPVGGTVWAMSEEFSTLQFIKMSYAHEIEENHVDLLSDVLKYAKELIP